MKKNIFLTCILLITGFLSSLPVNAKSGQIGEVRISGVLVLEPCVLRRDDENIDVDFGTIVDKYLYLNTKSHFESFDIHLDDCDINIANSVSVTFLSSNINSKLPGLLAIDSSSMAKNIAVAILDNNGNLIEINKPTPMYKLNNGSIVLQFKSYVEAEPDAIIAKSVELGKFTATATFLLTYD